MAKKLTQYRVFIASPGGLAEERQHFRRKLEKYTEMHSEPRNVTFHPVGWELTIGGGGRPQELINEDLKQCDYAVFVLHDRWGSATGDVYSSGVEEEWELAEQLYKANKIRNIALFFKTVDSHQLRDPGKQLMSVLTFKARIEKEKRYLFKQFDAIEEFGDILESHLASWLRDHENAPINLSIGGPNFSNGSPEDISKSPPLVPSPNSDFWIAEAYRLMEEDPANYNSVLFCAIKSINTAKSDIEWAQASNVAAIARS